jgi:hypothetical protein
MNKNTLILLFSNIAILVVIHLFRKPNETSLILYPTIIWMLFNIVAGIIIFFIDRELAKAFFLVGIVGALMLIGDSFCGLINA